MILKMLMMTVIIYMRMVDRIVMVMVKKKVKKG